MNITSRNGHLLVTGNVKSIEHYQILKNELEGMIETSSSIVIEFVDSMSLTSSVIGHLVHTVTQKATHIELRMHNDGLYELLQDLDLDKIMVLKKIS